MKRALFVCVALLLLVSPLVAQFATPAGYVSICEGGRCRLVDVFSFVPATGVIMEAQPAVWSFTPTVEYSLAEPVVYTYSSAPVLMNAAGYPAYYGAIRADGTARRRGPLHALGRALFGRRP